ncbi:hypothetical protein H0O01_03095, partial [Candidatus Micrarchaeota archaeon]|nr:hypothetical protein [Candidatus Micrarchaeota archaeon]
KEARVHFPSASDEAIEVFSKFLFVGSTSNCKLSNQLAIEAARSPLLYTEFRAMLENFPEGIKVVLCGDGNIHLYESAALLELGKQKPKESYPKVMSLRSAMKAAISMSGGDQAWPYDDTITARVLLAKFGNEKAEIQKYFDEIEKEGLVVDKMRIFRHVCAHFCLDRDGAAMLASFRFFADCDRKSLLASLNPEPEVAKTDKWDMKSRADFARYSKRVASAINPKSFADLLAFLDRLNNRKSHDSGISDVETLFGHLVAAAPVHLHASIMERLGITSLDNRQAIELSQRLILFGEGRTYVFMLCKGRAFSNDELVALKEAIGSDNMAFVVHGMLKAARSREDAFALLKFTVLRIFEGGAERILYPGDTLVGPDNIALDILRRYTFDMGNPEHLDQMLSVSCCVTDPNMRMRLQKAILARYAPMLDAKEAYALLFKDMRVADYAAVGAREEHLDKRVTDAAELDGIKKDILQRIKDAEAQAGNAMILGESLTRLLIRDKARLLRALLMTGESNRELRSYVGEEALGLYLYEREEVGVVDEGGWDSLRDTNIEEYENSLYKLDYEGRAILAQELLIGEKGVLLDKKTRKETLKWFFENFIEKPEGEDEKKVHSFIRRAFMAVAEGADVPTLYFLIHPIITERILAKPKHSEGWGEALRIAKVGVLLKSVKTAEDQVYHSSELEDAIYHVEVWVGHNRKDAELDVYDAYDAAQKNTVARLEEACTKYLDDFQDAPGPMKPIEFVKSIASKMGAPGVRFLQSLGIYADIPPSLRKEFDDVYDSVKGQLKLSALNTLQKEWGTDELERQLETFGSRVGGGSLVTVYDCVVNGRRCALKVVNPNIAYRTDAVCDNLVNIFSGDEELRRGLPLVENIREWIKTDVHFQGADYAEEFSAQNNGFKVKGNPYSISVPEVMRRGSKSVAEDYVEGTNLTKWEEASAAHDMGQVISLVVKNAVQQVANGLVHADMHVGNIRIAGGGKVAWLDNNFLLVLSGRDKEFIGSLACLANDKPALAKALSDYLCGFEENRHVDRASLEASLREIFVSNGHRDVGSFVSDAVAAISRHKGVVPLNVMLLAKNALALERMAKRAGFTNLMDAYFA